MNNYTKLFLSTGWLLPVAVALTYFGRWIREIVVPTLKGGNFDALYDLHGVRYLDITMVFTFIAFLWFAVALLAWTRRSIHAGQRGSGIQPSASL